MTITKKQLIKQAKTLGIKGRSEMTVEALSAAIAAATPSPEASPEPSPEASPEPSPEPTVDEKLAAKKVVKRTNMPWRRKFYHLDLAKYGEKAEEVKKSPNQVQLILRYMAENDMTSVESTKTGPDICGAAVASGFIKTKIDPPVLFAYYRKDMEALGLTFDGYNVA